MELLIQGLLSSIRNGDIHFENRHIQGQVEQRISRISNQLDTRGSAWALEELYEVTTILLGERKAYRLLRTMLEDYSTELSNDEQVILSNYVQMTEDNLRRSGINIDHLMNEMGFEREIERMHLSNTERDRQRFNEENPNTSYSGTDMVASITLPGKGPIVFGELANISYSILREKVPVRSLGRVSMKGYTRGMRTITGILSFTVFDESIVYRCMEELKAEGYRMLMDEMPLFDVTITMANEFGSQSSLTIYGVSTYTEGMVMSVQDMMTQNVYEFYALDVDPIMKRE